MNSRRLARTWPYPRYAAFEKELQSAAQAWFNQKGYPVHPRMPYLLAEWEHWPRNIILPEVAEYIQGERTQRASVKGFPLHKYVHHGLSSQAMLFNLIGPLNVRKDLSPLEKAFKHNNLAWPGGALSATFEYENRTIFNEDSGQPTSIDLMIQDVTGAPKIMVEAKLVEREFGGCSVLSSDN